jgi:hypothetical protein
MMKNTLLLISIAVLAGGCVVVPPDDGRVHDRDGGGGYGGGGYYGGGYYGQDGGYYRNHDDRRDGDRYERDRDERRGRGDGYDGRQPPQQYDSRWGRPQPAPTPANAAQGVYMGTQNAPRPMQPGMMQPGVAQPRLGEMPRAVNAPPRGPFIPGAAGVQARPQQQMRQERGQQAGRYERRDERDRGHDRKDERRDERGRGGEQDR